MNAADLIAQVKQQPRLQMEVGLLLDGTAFAEARRLQDRLARMAHEPEDDDVTADGVSQIVARLDEIYRETEETKFMLQALSAAEWEELNRKHEGAQDFAVALFAACCVEPNGWTFDTAKDLKGTLTAGQWATLVLALQQLNEGLFDLRPTRAATGRTHGTRQN